MIASCCINPKAGGNKEDILDFQSQNDNLTTNKRLTASQSKSISVSKDNQNNNNRNGSILNRKTLSR